MSAVEFSAEEIRRQAIDNTWAMMSLAIRHAGGDARAFFRASGRTFAPTWEGDRGKGPDAVMRDLLLNVVSTGGEVLDADLGVDVAAATVRLPGAANDTARFLGVGDDISAAALEVFVPIAEYLGLEYDFHAHGNTVHVTLARKPGG